MKQILKAVTAAAAMAIMSTQAVAGSPSFCFLPAKAVLETLTCIEQEDAQCAFDGYAPEFVKLHNGVDVNAAITSPEYWEGAFSMTDFSIDVNHVMRTGLNTISIRYVESVSLVTGQSFLQHEHALVTVNNDCKMVKWDQYGDNAEQFAVDKAVLDFLISIGVVPPEAAL